MDVAKGNKTICDQILTVFLQKSVNETVRCTSLENGKAPNEVLYIIGLLLAPIFACLTVAMFLVMVYVASRVSGTFSKLVAKYHDKTKSNPISQNRKGSIIICENRCDPTTQSMGQKGMRTLQQVTGQPPCKPPRNQSSRI